MESDNQKPRLDSVDERLRALKNELEELKLEIKQLRLRAEHKEGRHGEAWVAGCPFCPREMTAEQLPGAPARRATAVPGQAVRADVSAETSAFANAVAVAPPGAVLAIVGVFSRPLVTASDQAASQIVEIISDSLRLGTSARVLRFVPRAIGLLFSDDVSVASAELSNVLPTLTVGSLLVQAMLFRNGGTVASRVRYLSELAAGISGDVPFHVGDDGTDVLLLDCTGD